MSWRAYNNETVRVRLTGLDTAGVGVTGVTWNLSIMRDADGFFWNGAAFQSGATSVTMTAYDAANRPGEYYYDFANANITTSVRATTANASVVDKLVVGDIVFQGTSPDPSGANTVTLTIQAPGGTAQAGASVTIKNAAETATIYAGVTDASGQVVVALNNGTYHVLVSKPGVATWSTTVVVVSGTTAQTIVGTLFAPTPPVDPTLCAVYIYPNLDAVTNGVRFYALPNQVVSSVAIDGTVVTATVNPGGASADYYSAELVRGASYRIESTRFTFIDTTFEVPNLSSVNLATILEGIRDI